MKTKAAAFAGLLIFFSFFIILSLIASSKPPANNTGNNIPVNNTCGATGCPIMITLNSQEIAKHNNANDCWMIINSKVYDLTNFISLHSGGSQFIMQYCGLDGSAGFNTKDGMGSHSQRDMTILNQYYVGDLGQKIMK